MNILVLDTPALVDELKENHRVVTCGRRESRFDIVFHEFHPSLAEAVARCREKFFEPDVLLFIEGGVKELWVGVDQVPHLKAYYAIDSHLHVSWQQTYARIFDVLFVAHKDFIETFREWGSDRVHWLPPACSGARDRDLGLERDIDVCFVGSLDPSIHPERGRFMNAVRERLGASCRMVVTSGEYVEIYNRSRIVLNEAVNADLNTRVFEAMACGGMLLTDEIENGLTDLFSPGQDLVTYRHGDVEEAAEKILFYLEHDPERRAIAERGHRKVRERHTREHRVREMGAVLVEALKSREPKPWTSREFVAMGRTYLRLADPGYASYSERLQIATAMFLRAAEQNHSDGIQPYLALLAVLQKNPQAARDHLSLALTRPGDRAVASWISALLFSGEDSIEAERYYQSAVREMVLNSGVSREERECFQVASALFKEKIRWGV